MGCACVSPANATDTVTSSHNGTPHNGAHNNGTNSGHSVDGGSPIHMATNGSANNGVSFRSSNAAAMAALASSSNTMGKPPDQSQQALNTGTNGTSSGKGRVSEILVPGALQRASLDTPTNNGHVGHVSHTVPTTRSGTEDDQHDMKRPGNYLAADVHGRPYSRSGVNHITSATEKGPSQSQSPVDYKVSVAPLDEKTLRDRKRGVMGGGTEHRPTVTSTTVSQGTITSVSRGPTIEMDESGQPAATSSQAPKSAAAAILAAPVANRSSSASVTSHDRGQQKQQHHQHGHHHTHTHHANGSVTSSSTNNSVATNGTSIRHHDANGTHANNAANGTTGAAAGAQPGNARKEYRASISEDDWLHGTVKALSDVEALKKDAEIMTGSDAPPIMTAFALLQSTNRRNILTTMATPSSYGHSLSPHGNGAGAGNGGSILSAMHNRTKSAPPPPVQRDAPQRAVAMAMAPPMTSSSSHNNHRNAYVVADTSSTVVTSSSSSTTSSQTSSMAIGVTVPLPGSASGSPDHSSSSHPSAPVTTVISPRSQRGKEAAAAALVATEAGSSVAAGAGERLLRTGSSSAIMAQ